jgi:hypothetical protein
MTNIIIKRIASTQKLRIVCGDVSLYTTVGKVRCGLGESHKFNAATQKAVDALEFMRSGVGAASKSMCGLVGNWEGMRIQLDFTTKSSK